MHKNTLGPTGLYEVVLVAVAHGKLLMYSVKCQGPLHLLSPHFRIISTTKQMRPNGKGGGVNNKLCEQVFLLHWLSC